MGIMEFSSLILSFCSIMIPASDAGSGFVFGLSVVGMISSNLEVCQRSAMYRSDVVSDFLLCTKSPRILF